MWEVAMCGMPFLNRTFIELELWFNECPVFFFFSQVSFHLSGAGRKKRIRAGLFALAFLAVGCRMYTTSLKRSVALSNQSAFF